MSDQAIVIDTPAGIQFVRILALRGALRLEVAGMKRRGTSAYSVIKKEFGLRGSKQAVLEQVNTMIEKAKQQQAVPNV